MVLRTLIALVALVAFSIVLSFLCWAIFGEGLSELRIWWRVRSIRRQTQRNLSRRQVLSPAWVRRLQEDPRVEFHGPSIAWPIQKKARVDRQPASRVSVPRRAISINGGPTPATIRAIRANDSTFGR